MAAQSPHEGARVPEKAGALLRGVDRTHWGWIALFASTTTLVCCALPILLVSVGLGAASAALFSTVPMLAVLAKYKIWLFAGSAAFLALGGWALFRPGRTCPTDPDLAAKCETAHRWNLRLFYASGALWAVGFAAAYLSAPLLNFFPD